MQKLGILDRRRDLRHGDWDWQGRRRWESYRLVDAKVCDSGGNGNEAGVDGSGWEWKGIRRSGVEAGRGHARQDKPRQVHTRQQVLTVVPVCLSVQSVCLLDFFWLALSHTKICIHYAYTTETTIETMGDRMIVWEYYG